jgi:putative cardiolipin synthase
MLTMHSLTHRIGILSLTLLLLGACASLPEDLQQEYSEGYAHPGKTFLGRIIDETAPADKTLSGVELLSEPEEAFRTRFAIANLAEKTLDLQYYLWKGDLAGGLLMWAALDAADRGVRVRFLIDDIYHSGRDDMYALLDSHDNFEVRIFNPMANRGAGRYVDYLMNRKHLNHRMHNKIFLADNAVAVLGGRNIGNDYFGVDTKANFFDLDVLTVGQGAREAGAAFDEYWNSKYAVPIGTLHKKEVSEKDLHEARLKLDGFLEDMDAMPYPLSIDSDDTVRSIMEWRDQLAWVEAHVVVDPLERFEGQGTSAIVDFNREHISEINQQFMAESAYLIPSGEGLAAMKVMTDRGVRVRLLTNSLQSNNHISAHSGYLKYRKDILRTGAELYELRADAALREHFEANNKNHEVPAGIHTKSFVLDENQALIGSFNFDPRSRDLNSEIGLVIKDAGFAQEVIAVMEEDFDPQNSYRLFLDENDNLRWEGQDENGNTVIYKRDPGAPWWRRTLARFLSWMPIEKDL